MRVLAGLSKRTVLRAGYGAVITVLVLSAAEAYRIQLSVSEQHLEIYRRYADQDDTLATLRRNLWLAGNYVRDYFINTTPGQAEALRRQLEDLKGEDEKALASLARNSNGFDTLPKLRKSLGEFWAALDPIPGSMMHDSNERKFEFLQREVVPRRGELYNVLLDLAATGQQKMQDGEKQFATSRSQAAHRLLLMLGMGLMLSCLVALASIRHSESLEREAESHMEAIEGAKQELQQLSARLLEVEEEGRRKLSRELHDEIGQSLALLQIEITRAQAVPAGQTAQLRERLDRARELAERTVQTARNISGLLRPALLDDLGLVPALQFQLEDFLRRNSMACEFIEEGVADRLPDAAKTCVFRVVQEALHNCEKHSGASKVKVTVRQIPHCLLAEVEDDGRGFAAADPGRFTRNRGLGLLGMRERAANAGGSLEVHSSPGHGTRVSLRIPIPDEAVRPAQSPQEVAAS
jgi:signal transduction histidine kinase